MSAVETYRFFDDRDGHEIQLPARVWFGHVLANHPEMDGQEWAVEQTLRYPLVVNRDVSHRDRRNFYRDCAVSGFQSNVLVKVVVQYTVTIWGDRTGVILTAYVTDVIPSQEERLWPNGNP